MPILDLKLLFLSGWKHIIHIWSSQERGIESCLATCIHNYFSTRSFSTGAPVKGQSTSDIMQINVMWVWWDIFCSLYGVWIVELTFIKHVNCYKCSYPKFSVLYRQKISFNLPKLRSSSERTLVKILFPEKKGWFRFAYYMYISPPEGTGISDTARPFRMLLELQVQISLEAFLKEKTDCILDHQKECGSH